MSKPVAACSALAVAPIFTLVAWTIAGLGLFLVFKRHRLPALQAFELVHLTALCWRWPSAFSVMPAATMASSLACGMLLKPV